MFFFLKSFITKWQLNAEFRVMIILRDLGIVQGMQIKP